MITYLLTYSLSALSHCDGVLNLILWCKHANELNTYVCMYVHNGGEYRVMRVI